MVGKKSDSWYLGRTFTFFSRPNEDDVNILKEITTILLWLHRKASGSTFQHLSHS